MNTEKWDNFQTAITSHLTQQTNIITDTNTSIDKLWHTLQTAILISTNKNIPFLYRTNRTHKTFSPAATKLHCALNNINNIIQTLTKLNKIPEDPAITNTIQNLNFKINQINNNTDLDISLIPLYLLLPPDITSLIQDFKVYQKTIYTARNIENNTAQNEQI